ncbi:MAG: biopolymer transporter ExbD [bacterium]|nr:biopolymer transporter ExbD [bacterium]
MRFETPSRSEPADESMIPLVNVVFLLLIFFVLTGTLTPPDPLSVLPPESASGASVTHDAVVVLLSADGRVAIRGEEIPLDALASEVEERLADELSLGVQLEADRGASSRMLLDVLDSLREIGIERVVIRTRRAAEP